MRGQQRTTRRLVLVRLLGPLLANPVHRDTVRFYVVRIGANGQLPNACADCSADLCAVATTVHGGADATADDVAAIDGRPIGRSDVAAVGCSGSGAISRAESAPDFRAVARADRKPCAHDELATNRGTDDRTTEPHAVDRADTAPDASADDA